jgi:MFS family permease
MPSKFSSNIAINFVILFGIVSMFSDMTYEGARSIIGPYLAILGSSAATVGFISGLGELIGYCLRMISGYFADRSGKYWLLTVIGYLTNLIAVPLLAFAKHWWIAAILIIIERIGKAIRTPARDAMLSHAGHSAGEGWSFGLHDAFNQFGAMLGPLLVAAMLYANNSNYQKSFAVLFFPALLAIIVLAFTQKLYPKPENFENKSEKLAPVGTNRTFWLYLAGAALIAAGSSEFPLIAYHFEKMTDFSPAWTPMLYAFAMGAAALSAPILGRLYDKKGFIILVIASVLSCCYSPFVFIGDIRFIIFGIVLWSVGAGVHGALMRAVVANLVAHNKRASAYGIFNMGYGICCFLGNTIMGILYDRSITSVVVFSITIQIIALPILWMVTQQMKKKVTQPLQSSV